jgi:NitT/TauT family transport system substrate-binding protein
MALCRFFVMFSLLILMLVGCAPANAPSGSDDLTPVHLYLSYQPDIQFAPFYVAMDEGFFREHGLDVTISHEAESEAVRLVGIESPDEGIRAAVVGGEQVLLARAQDIPIVYVYAWYQKFPIAIASRQAQNIVTVNDLAGHSVGVSMLEGGSYIGLRALLAAGGLSESDIDLQVTGFTQVETLLTDRVDAIVVYSANEPVQLAAAGAEVNLINLSDYVDLVSNGLVISEQTAQDDPEIVRLLLAAFTEALQFTMDHPDEAFEMSKAHVEGLSDGDVQAAQREVLARSIDLWKAERPGETNVAAWLAMQDVLTSMGLLTEPPDVEQAFTNDFLP